MVNFVGCEVFLLISDLHKFCAVKLCLVGFSVSKQHEREKKRKNVGLVSIWSELNELTKYYSASYSFTIFCAIIYKCES